MADAAGRAAPRTWRRSTPASRARWRTAGEAIGFSRSRSRRQRAGVRRRARFGAGCRRRLLRRWRAGGGGACGAACGAAWPPASSVALARHFEPHQLGADRQHVADLAAQRQHRAGDRRRESRPSPCRSSRRRGSGPRHRVADLDVPFDHFGLGHALADIGQLDDARSPSQASTTALSARPTRAGPGK